MGWMQDYLDDTVDLESPKSYFYWSILTVASAVVGKKLWINRGGVYKLYPNIYTFLVSKRSGLRKGVPVNVAKKLAHEYGKIRVIDGQNSIQGVIKELSQVRTIPNNGSYTSGHVIKDAQGFLITGEFASFLLSDGVGYSLTTLTDLYDSQYHEQGFRKRLAGTDEIELKNLCLTSLFASNETHFFDSVPSNAIRGGFLARTFIVYEEKRNTYNSLTGLPKPEHITGNPIPKVIDYDKIIGYLQKINELSGPFIVDPAANRVFDDWYYPFSEKDHEIEDTTGTSERIGDSIWKAAMLISLVNAGEKIIYKENMEEAIEKTLETFTNVNRLLLAGSSNTTVASITIRTMIAVLIEASPKFEAERKDILKRGIGVFGVYDLDACIEHLFQAGMIKMEKRGQGQYYKLTEAMIKRHLNMNKEIN